MTEQEQNTANSQVSADDFAAWEQARNASLRGDESAAGEEKPAAESASDSETLEEKKESEGEEPKADTEAKAAEEPAEDGEEDEEEEKPKEEGDKPRRKGGFKKKIDNLTKRNYALAAQNRELADKLAALEGSGNSKADKPAEKAGDAKPKSEDFEDFDTFAEALNDWMFQQRASKDAEEKAKASEQEARKLSGEKYLALEKDAREKYADFDEVLADADDIEAPQHLMDLLIEAGPEVAYHLAKDRDEAIRISKLGPTAAAREIGKIEARIAASSKPTAEPTPKPQPKKTTSAPKPPKAIGGGAAAVKDVDDPNTPFDEWERERNRQLQKR